MDCSQRLSEVDLFKDLPEEQITAIAKICQEVNYSKGEMIFDESERAENLYILMEGRVSIRMRLSSKPQSITVSVLNDSPQSFGWSGVVSPYFYTAFAMCEDDCRLLALSGQKLIEVLRQEPVSGFEVMRRISEVISSRLRNSRMVLLKSL
jgi:toluene monooxygenase system ferredoxin subunit